MRRNVFYDPDNDYYEVIGVTPNADTTTIQRAYRAKAKQLHPDVNQDRHEWAKERFQLLNEAYSVLNDVETRRIYDNLRWPYQFHTAEQNASPHGRSSTSERRKSTWHYEERPYQEYYRPPRQQPFTQATPQPRPPRALWLDELHLGWLRPTYIAVANLVESPYRYILLFIGVLLAANVIFVALGVFRSQDASDEANEVIVATSTLNSPPVSKPPINAIVIPTHTLVPSVTPLMEVAATLTPQPSPTITPTPQPSEMDCHPDIEIFTPPNGQTIYRHSLPEDVQMTGRIAVPDMYTYSVEAYLIDAASLSLEPIVLRELSVEPDAPIESGTIVQLDSLRYDAPPGAYQVVIFVWDNQQALLGQCSIVVVKGE